NVDPSGLLPTSLRYWAYEGSLTTPPCSEIVDWMIAQDPIEVDAADIDRFTALYSMNARPALVANRRYILAS
ncbi:carbonate dehydratase, partial [Sinorhizobium medicae]